MNSTQFKINAEQTPLFISIQQDEVNQLRKLRRRQRSLTQAAAFLEANKEFLECTPEMDPLLEREFADVIRLVSQRITHDEQIHYHFVADWARRLFNDSAFEKLMTVPALSRAKCFGNVYATAHNINAPPEQIIRDSLPCHNCRAAFTKFSRIMFSHANFTTTAHIFIYFLNSNKSQIKLFQHVHHIIFHLNVTTRKFYSPI
jgi:hypothetical protein